MSSSDEFEDLVVTVRREEKSRSRTGRASRLPRYGEIRGGTRGASGRTESPGEFWQEVISGRLGLRALEKRTCQQVQSDRGMAALLEGQLVTLPKDAMVGIDYELAEDNIAST